jgi:hypothetical protein
MVYNSQNNWVCGLVELSIILNWRAQRFGNYICFHFREELLYHGFESCRRHGSMYIFYSVFVLSVWVYALQ